jgi:hypothetical protein
MFGVGAQREQVPAYDVRQANRMWARIKPVSSPPSEETEAQQEGVAS